MTKGVWKTFNVINGMPWIVVEFCRYKRIVEMMTYFLLSHKLHDVMHTFFIIIVFFFIVDFSINIQIWNLITENVALKKPAGQIYTYLSRHQFRAERAVDGQKSDLSSIGGQCAISGNGQLTADWWVDLGKVLSIHHVSIQYMTENRTWGMVLKIR